MIHGIEKKTAASASPLNTVWHQFEKWVKKQCGNKLPVLMAYNGKKFDFDVIKN